MKNYYLNVGSEKWSNVKCLILFPADIQKILFYKNIYLRGVSLDNSQGSFAIAPKAMGSWSAFSIDVQQKTIIYGSYGFHIRKAKFDGTGKINCVLYFV